MCIKSAIFVYQPSDEMRTNIELDDELLEEYIKLSGAKTKKEAVNDALRKAVAYYSRLDILSLKGKIKWEGNLDAVRSYDKWQD